jgi:hypothetical protein
MMNILIAVVAGCASALMFVSLISGALISVVLCNLAPLPLMVAALGWGPQSALVGAVVAGAGLGLALGPAFFFAFVITVGLPAYWLGYLALLAKPASVAGGMNGSSPAAADALEWYPLGRLLLWVAAFAFMIVTVSALLTVGTDYEAITKGLRDAFARVLTARGGTPPDTDIDRVVDVMAQIFPAAATQAMMLTLTLNLWLAGRIVLKSGRLRRPWPDLHGTELPRIAALVLAAVFALTFADGLIGMLAQMASAALLLAYLFVGFAVLHAVTQGGRWWWRVGAYGVIFMLMWPLLLVPMLGLLDGPLGLRRRFGNAAQPPPSLSS